MRFYVFSALLLILSGCFGTPDLPRLADVDLAEGVPTAGLIAPDVEAPKTAIEELDSVNKPDNFPIKPDQNQGDAAITPDKPRKRGLFGFFGRKAKEDLGQDVSMDQEPDPVKPEMTAAKTTKMPDAKVTPVSALSTEDDAVKNPRGKTGLFGPRRNRAAENTEIAPDAALPFGEIGRACGVKGKALGKEIDRFPKKGKGYRLYDSNPSITEPRTFYLTGLKGGCAVQFTAAMAMLDTPVLHEHMRYDKSNKDYALNATDAAYEQIKSRLCKSENGKPCPEKRVSKLEKTTAYVTAYPRFATNAKWFDILIHKGKITSSSTRSR